MPFDLETAIAVREREDGLYEKDTFDLATAIPVDDNLVYSSGNVVADFAKAGVKEGTKFKEVEPNWILSTMDEANRELTDLLTMPFRAVGLPHPPMMSALATETIPNLFHGLTKNVYTGRNTIKEEKYLTPEEKSYAQPAPNRPGWFEVAEQLPAWQVGVEIGANVFVLGYAGVQGFKAVKTELGIRQLARDVQKGSQQFADLFIKTARPEELKAVQNAYQAKYDTEILNAREALVQGYQREALNKLSALEAEMPGQTVAQMKIKGMNFFKILGQELKTLNLQMGETGQALLKRPEVGDVVSFTYKGNTITETIQKIVGNRVEFPSGIVATISQLSIPAPTAPPTGEGKVLRELPIEKQKLAYSKFIEQGNQDTFEGFVKQFGNSQFAETGEPTEVGWMQPKLSPTGEGKVIYVGKQEGKPQGKYIYGAENKEYAKKFGEQISEQTIIPQNTFDLTSLKETSISFDKLAKTLKDNGVSIDKTIVGDDDVYKPAWQWIRKYPEIADKIKEAGFDSIKQLETFTGKGKKELTYQVLDNKILSQPTGQKPPVESPKTTVSGEPSPEEFDKLQKDYIRATPVGKVLTKSASIKQEIANEEFIIKTYENDIAKLENQIKVEQFNTEAEKVKAQYKLEKLKDKYALAKETQRQKKAYRDEVAGLVRVIQTTPKENIDIEYQNMIEQLQSKFDLKRRTEATEAKRENMKAFVERMKVEGKPIPIPAEKLAMLDKVTLNDMTLDQLREIKQTIDDLERLGKTKLKARKAVYEAKKERTKIELMEEATPINSKQLPKVPIGDKVNSWVERAIALQNYAQKTGVGLTPIDGLADVTGMTGMKQILDADFSDYLTYNDEAIKQWYELTKDFTDKEFERIGVIAASRQDGGLERLANSGITEEEVNAIKLTPEEEKVYQFVLDTFDKEYPAVKQYSKEVYNADVGEQENYVSFMSDYDQMSDLEIYQRFGQTPEQIASRKTKTVEQGFTKERAGLSKIKLETNIDKIFRRHMDDVAYMLNTGKNIKMYFEIVNSPEMREKLGDTGTLAWLQWLDLMARKGGTEGAKRIAALDIIRRNIGAGVLSFRLSSALVQFSSFADTIATIGAEWATKGASAISTSKDWRNFIMDNFPEIKKAIGDDIAFREFGEGFLANLTRVGLKPLQVLDGLMRSTAAAGSYIKLCAEKGIAVDLKNPNAGLVAEATRLMRQSQGSSFFKDQPLAITAGYGLTDNKSLNKTILTFQSFMLNRWDNINRQIWRMGIKEKDYGKAISSVFWLLVFAGGVEEGIRRGARKITGALAKDKRKEQDFMANTILNILQSVPLLGQLVSSITYSSNPVPVINTFEELLGGLGSAIKGKAIETKLRGIIRAIGASGSLAGIPGSSQASQIIRSAIPKAGKKKYW
jgi:hypothetical protein